MGDNVRGVQGQLGEIQDAQAYNSKGIFLLLKVVGELAHQNDFKLRSRNELEQFSREPPPLTYGGGPAPVRYKRHISSEAELLSISCISGAFVNFFCAYLTIVLLKYVTEYAMRFLFAGFGKPVTN